MHRGAEAPGRRNTQAKRFAVVLQEYLHQNSNSRPRKEYGQIAEEHDTFTPAPGEAKCIQSSHNVSYGPSRNDLDGHRQTRFKVRRRKRGDPCLVLHVRLGRAQTSKTGNMPPCNFRSSAVSPAESLDEGHSTSEMGLQVVSASFI